jgi:hypothetical protein
MKELKARAKDKKRELSNGFVSICGINIETKMFGDSFHVTRKIDGEFNLLKFEEGEAILVNSSGNVKDNIKILKDITKHLKSKNIKSLECMVELHVNEDEKRARIYDLLSLLSDKESEDLIEISPFELIEVDGECFEDFGENIKKLNEIFDIDKLSPVKYTYCDSKSDVKDIFEKWVREENSEGLIVRTQNRFRYKIKPLHSVDYVVLGYTQKGKDRINVLLVGLMHEDGTIQEIGSVGTGLDEDERVDLYKKLSPLLIESKYISTDSDGLAFRLVRPKVVVEVDLNDIIVEKKTGYIKSSLLNFVDGEGYKFIKQTNSASMIHPRISRIRDDKEAIYEDVGFRQLTDLKHIDKSKISQELPKSELLSKEVYTKESKGKKAIQKFIIFKTNKENLDQNYLAYIFVYINFSATRKEMFKKDIRVSNSLEQLQNIAEEFKIKNIKKGWKQYI